MITELGLTRVMDKLIGNIGNELVISDSLWYPLDDPMYYLSLKLDLTHGFDKDKLVKLCIRSDDDSSSSDSGEDEDKSFPRVHITMSSVKYQVWVSIAYDSFEDDQADKFNEQSGLLEGPIMNLQADYSRADVAKLARQLNHLAKFTTCTRCDEGFVATGDADFCSACELRVTDADLVCTECDICTEKMYAYTARTLSCCGNKIHAGCTSRCKGRCPFCRKTI